uniref:SGNH hydrolase-type esterase domain-containing protein n=1 Tax=Salarias fasciatus TaxID=181472 RepID=A0A672FGU3_SALFA
CPSRTASTPWRNMTARRVVWVRGLLRPLLLPRPLAGHATTPRKPRHQTPPSTAVAPPRPWIAIPRPRKRLPPPRPTPPRPRRRSSPPRPRITPPRPGPTPPPPRPRRWSSPPRPGSIRNIHFFNAITRCIPGATVPTILHGLPELLQSLPSTVRRVIVHVGTNDTARRQSEVTKQDFKDLFNLLESCGRLVFISGPLPTFFRGAERFSRLLGLNTWLQRSCTASNFYFIDNFNLFWNRPAFYHQDGLHPSTLGSSILAGNIQHTVHTSPTD